MFGDNSEVLIICPFTSPNLGGVETHIDKLVSSCNSRDIISTVVSYQPLVTKAKAPIYELRDTAKIFRIPWPFRGLYPKLEPYYPLVVLYLFPGLFLFSFFYMVKRHTYIKTIHAHGFVSGIVAVLLSLVFNKRMVLSTHAVYCFKSEPALRAFWGFLLKRFDSILAVSETSRQEILTDLKVPSNKVSVHPNWIDTQVFVSSDTHSFSKDISLLYVGRLTELKGIKLLHEVAKRLPGVDIDLVGKGELYDFLVDNPLPNLKIHGALFQSSEEDLIKLVRLYQSSTYLISPYLYDEGFSSSLIESISCGTKVIIPNRGSPPTFLNSSVAEFLDFLPPVDNIVQKINNISKSYDRIIVRNYAIKHFSEKNSSVIIESYKL